MRKTDRSAGGRDNLGAIARGRLGKEAAAPCEMFLGPWENVTGEGQRRRQAERAVDPALHPWQPDSHNPWLPFQVQLIYPPVSFFLRLLKTREGECALLADASAELFER